MPSFNRVIFIGRLTRDPEMRYTSSGLAVTSFSIAVDRRGKSTDGQKQTDFFRCSAWRQLAEIVNEYARKGMLVAVDGSIRISEYQGQDGTTRTGVDVDVDNFQMLERSGEVGNDGGYQPEEDERPARPQRAAAPARGRDDEDEDEDRPARPARAAAPARSESREAPARADERPAPRRAPAKAAAEPMYPEDDFDDSDPFADE